MGQMLVVTLREGIEAFLIVAIAAAYLTKTCRARLLPAVWWGAATASGLSLALVLFLSEAVVTPFWDGVLACVAAVPVVSMVVYMLNAANRLRVEINERIEAAARRPGAAAWLGVRAFTVLIRCLCTGFRRAARARAPRLNRPHCVALLAMPQKA